VNLHSLNPQQRQAVAATSGPVLILAGAGTGKTRVITTRIAYLISQGVPPENILAVTFTNKAAREMAERVRQLVPQSPRLKASKSSNIPTVCTFHSLCVRILRQHIERLGYKRNFVIYDESEQLGAVKKIMSRISAKGEETDPQVILGMLSRFRNGGERAAVFSKPEVAAMAEHVREHYESALKACNAVDFDDLILLVLRLFVEHPDVLDACRDKYRYVMVDEYQDTNASQFRLVHSLAQKHRNLCVVGDDDQSIYGWRGAEIANLLEMEKYYPEVVVIKLEQNYRSTTTILDAANALIKQNTRRRGKKLWSQQGAGAKITLFVFQSDEEEATTIVEEIEFVRQGRRVPWSDQAILFRTNGQSRQLETALRKAGVPYHLVGGQSFFDRREVRDLLAYFKVFANPNDDVSLLRIANVPARGLTDTTMQRLLGASQERKCPVYVVMRDPVIQSAFPLKARESIEAFVELVDSVRARLQQPVTAPNPSALQQWAEGFLQLTGYFEYLRRGEKDKEAAANRERNLREILCSLDPAGAPTQPLEERLELFLEEIALDHDREEEREEKGDAVTLITMHSCKGLEFPHVYVVGLEEGLLPHSRSKEEDTLDEERRLFYVAITRAMKQLSLSWCSGRKKYGQVVPGHPSRFLEELPSELIELANERSNEPVAPSASKDWFAAMRSAID